MMGCVVIPFPPRCALPRQAQRSRAQIERIRAYSMQTWAAPGTAPRSAEMLQGLQRIEERLARLDAG